MNKELAVEVSGLVKVYHDGDHPVPVLSDVTFSVARGETVAILGSSGSGKSTAMNIIGALDSPTAGAYLFSGMHVESLSRDQRALLRRKYLGFVFQGFNLLARTTALENVELPLLYRGMGASERRKLARAALDRVGLLDWEHHTPEELSGGQQQRVAIARAIVTRPKLLLADEPTGSLDTARSEEIMALLSALNAEDGITVVLVTHEPDMARYAKRHLVFRDGLLISDSKTEAAS